MRISNMVIAQRSPGLRLARSVGLSPCVLLIQRSNTGPTLFTSDCLVDGVHTTKIFISWLSV